MRCAASLPQGSPAAPAGLSLENAGNRRTVTLLLEGVNAGSVDQPPSGTSAGDEIIGEGRLVCPHNAAAGLLEIEETLTGLGAESGTGRIQMQGTALLAGGQIDLAGVLRINASRSPSITIVGGTGAYRGARGQLFVRTAARTRSSCSCSCTADPVSLRACCTRPICMSR